MNDLTAMLLSMHEADEPREEYLRLPYAYPGSKAEDVKLILPHIPYGSGYGEPFGGTGAVLLNREPSKLEIWNDRYSGICCFMRVVRDPATFDRFMARTAEMSLHSREEFIWCKRTWENVEDEVERAARWYYAARFAINGKVASTFGRAKDVKVRFSDRLVKSLPLFPAIHYRLRSVTLENLDWRVCLNDFDQKGFVWYLDPTYLDSFPGTYQHELSVADHKELALRIPSLRGAVIMSSFDGPQTMAIYDKPNLWDDRIYWNRTTTMRTQAYTDTNNLTADAHKGRDIVKEVLWVRYAR